MRLRGHLGSLGGQGLCVPRATDHGGRCGGDTDCVPEGIQDRIVDKVGVFPVPQILEDNSGGDTACAPEGIWDRLVEKDRVFPVLQILEDGVEAV